MVSWKRNKNCKNKIEINFIEICKKRIKRAFVCYSNNHVFNQGKRVFRHLKFKLK